MVAELSWIVNFENLQWSRRIIAPVTYQRNVRVTTMFLRRFLLWKPFDSYSTCKSEISCPESWQWIGRYSDATTSFCCWWLYLVPLLVLHSIAFLFVVWSLCYSYCSFHSFVEIGRDSFIPALSLSMSQYGLCNLEQERRCVWNNSSPLFVNSYSLRILPCILFHKSWLLFLVQEGVSRWDWNTN